MVYCQIKSNFNFNDCKHRKQSRKDLFFVDISEPLNYLLYIVNKHLGESKYSYSISKRTDLNYINIRARGSQFVIKVSQ